MVDNRLNREIQSRESTQRKMQWKPPETLPTPAPQAGWVFRWIRTSFMGQADPTNTSAKMREGWEPVMAEEQPKLRLLAAQEGRFKDSIEIGGLVLCKIPVEFTEDRDAYYLDQANAQMNSVDNNFMRESDPRMPMFKERSTKVTFGKGM